MAARRVLSYVTLVSVENSTETQLADRLKACNLGSGVPGRAHIAFVYDANTNSESITAPDIRGSPFQQKYYHKVVNACRKCRCDEETMKLPAGDVVLMSDGGKHGDLPALLCRVSFILFHVFACLHGFHGVAILSARLPCYVDKETH